MSEETLESEKMPIPPKAKEPAKATAKKEVVKATNKVNWSEVETDLVKAIKANNWSMERHRSNPKFVVNIIIKNVVPKVLDKLL